MANTTLFEMTIKLGRQSLRALLQSQALQTCIPSSDSNAWIALDVANEKIVVQLL
jgi:hypothetical protein